MSGSVVLSAWQLLEGDTLAAHLERGPVSRVMRHANDAGKLTITFKNGGHIVVHPRDDLEVIA